MTVIYETWLCQNISSISSKFWFLKLLWYSDICTIVHIQLRFNRMTYSHKWENIIIFNILLVPRPIPFMSVVKILVLPNGMIYLASKSMAKIRMCWIYNKIIYDYIDAEILFSKTQILVIWYSKQQIIKWNLADCLDWYHF